MNLNLIALNRLIQTNIIKPLRVSDSFLTPSQFNQNFRVFNFNFGRQSGKSSAIQESGLAHPKLVYLCIHRFHSHIPKETLPNVVHTTLKSFEALKPLILASNIIIFEDTSYQKTSNKFNPLRAKIISEMNTNNNLPQILIELG